LQTPILQGSAAAVDDCHILAEQLSPALRMINKVVDLEQKTSLTTTTAHQPSVALIADALTFQNALLFR